MLTLLAAVTAVRAFGIARGVLRYAERLTAHDAAFRVLGELRGTAYARLARLAPAGLAELRSGDLLTRLVGDVDGLADLWLRVLLPYASVAIVAIGTVVLIGWLLPAAGLVLAVSLLVTAVASPLAAGAVSRRAEARPRHRPGVTSRMRRSTCSAARRRSSCRGGLPRAIAGVARVDAHLADVERRSASGAGRRRPRRRPVRRRVGVGGARARASSPCSRAASRALRSPSWCSRRSPSTSWSHRSRPSARLLPGLAASASRLLDIVHRPDPVPEPEASVAVAVPRGPLGLVARRPLGPLPGRGTDGARRARPRRRRPAPASW